MSVKILTVDDSKTIRLIVSKAFKQFDCVVLEAANGVVGLAIASNEKPDVILLDYTMPIMDGFEVLARLRSDPILKAIPVIMLTAEAGRETVIKIAKLGVRDYLIKPFKEDLLIERVRRVVSLEPRCERSQSSRRFDDLINILVVDDKPAIVEQIRAGLADTNWIITSADQPGQALDRCLERGIDLVLVSLSLPKDGAYLLLQNLRGHPAAAFVPVFGLSVKTATNEQSRAQEAGFAGLVTKPIDIEELKSKVARALKLETSYKYFHERPGVLALKLPKELSQTIANEVWSRVDDRLAAAVDAGGDKLIIDLSEMERASLPLIQLVLSAIGACRKLSLRHAIVASPAMRRECCSYEETQAWLFAETFEQALPLLESEREKALSPRLAPTG